MTKPELVECLLTIEQAYAEVAEQQARLQFELLESQHKQEEEKQGHRK
jgi:hypothetical protein